MTERLRSESHPWPQAAATLLAARGRLGLDREGFARALGIESAVVAALEDGTATASEVEMWTNGRLKPERPFRGRT